MRNSFLLALIAVALWPSVAFAHPSDAAHVHSLTAGLLHPLTGFDHLLAMVAVGAWGASLGRANAWLVPSAFVTGMAIGIFGGGALAGAAWIETAIAASLIGLGLFLALTVQLPRGLAMALCGLAGLVHGAAHASEGPTQTAFFAFAVGALAMTAALHGAGVSLGLLATRLPALVVRMAGAAIALVGACYLAV